MKSNKELVEHLISAGVLKTPCVIDAFLNIDRKDFTPEEFIDEAYEDYPLPIKERQTISQPLTVAFMLELLEPRFGDKVLDIGFGSGWTAALLAYITGNKGKVYAIELVPEVFEFGKSNISKYNFIGKGIIEIFCKDGSRGLRQFSPFDKILVSAAAKNIPQAFIEQLSYNGILVIPDSSGIWKITKSERKYFPGFAFVPLIEK